MMSSHPKLKLRLMQKSTIQKQYHVRNSSIQAHSANRKPLLYIPQTEKSTRERIMHLQILFRFFQDYRARALAWACRRAAVSVWEPCMAIESAVWPRWRTESEKILNSEPMLSSTHKTWWLWRRQCLLVSPDWNTLTITERISLTFGKDIHSC